MCRNVLIVHVVKPTNALTLRLYYYVQSIRSATCCDLFVIWLIACNVIILTLVQLLDSLYELFINARTWTILTFWHRSFTFNSNKSPTWCNNFSVYYPDICLQLNMFWAFSRPWSGAQWLQWQPLVSPSYRGDSRAVVGLASRPPRPRTLHDYPHDTKVKP
jgi:hypothetical protein